MKLYKVISSDYKFEYSYIGDKLDLRILNKYIQTEYNYSIPLMNGDDISIIKNGGGTVMHVNGNISESKSEWYYLIDLDFNRAESYEILDNYLYDKFESIRQGIKRDIKLTEVLK